LPVSAAGIWVIVVNTTAVSYNITTTSGNINGSAPPFTSSANQVNNFICDGTNWWYNV
jgi:hypothetical protein